jgi:hypothetical protein
MRLTGRITGPRKPTIGAYAAMVLSLLVFNDDTPEAHDRVRWAWLTADGARIREEAARLGIGEDEVRVREMMAASVMDPVVA